jgi:peptidyl-tRNA hydrolase, PTH1 family
VDQAAASLSISVRKRLFRAYAAGSGTHSGSAVHLVKPLTFMNASGRVFPRALRDTGVSLGEILVVYDSLDISPGNCRLRLKGSSGGHKGIESIIHWLGTEDFMRLAVGIGRPPDQGDVVSHVLGAPEGPEAAAVERGVLAAANAVIRLLSTGAIQVMNEINRKEVPS